MTALINPFFGEVSRREWWLLQLAIVILVIFGFFMTATLASDPNLPRDQRTAGESSMVIIVIVSAIYMNFSSCINRLRDSGRTGLWYLSFLLPTVGTGLMIYFCGIEAGNKN